MSWFLSKAGYEKHFSMLFRHPSLTLCSISQRYSKRQERRSLQQIWTPNTAVQIEQHKSETSKYNGNLTSKKCRAPAQTTARKSQRTLVPSPQQVSIAVIWVKGKRYTDSNWKTLDPKTWFHQSLRLWPEDNRSPGIFLNHEVSKKALSQNPSAPASQNQ